MSLVTRCPQCQTLFRVGSAQLEKRAGKVRCGRCMHVFDGFQSLAAEQPNALPAPSADATVSEQTAASAKSASAAGTVAPPAGRRPLFRDKPADTSAAAAEPAAASASEAGGSPDLLARDERLTLARRLTRKPSPAQLWSVGAAALGVLLLLQMALAYRSELAARYGFVRSAYTALCARTGCTVALPQRPDLVRIEASDVHMIDASRPQLIQLTATLRSYAGYDLGYPALDLVLTNSNEHALARRIFMPDEYLDRMRDPAVGIAPNAEITVAIDLDTGNLNAAGFRLDLLPAPASSER